MKLFLTFISFIICINTCLSQGYEIKIKPSHLEPQKVRLAYYYEDKQYLITDSASSENGFYVFRGNENLPSGIYSVILDKNAQVIDILIDENNQKFVMKCDANDPQKTMKITGSEMNSNFFDYQRRMTDIVIKQHEIDTLKKYTTDSSKIEKLDIELSKIDAVYNEAWKIEASKNHNTFFEDVLKCMNSTNFSNQEMWNYVNFSQKGLIRTPFFYKVIRSHIAHYIESGVPEIIRQTDKLINLSKENIEVYHYVTGYLLNFYRGFFKLGMNEVFVHIADSYFLNDTVKGLPEETHKMIENQRDIYKSAIIGYDAHNIKVRKINSDDSISIFDYSSSKPILILFWANGCGHCDSAENSLKLYYPQLIEKGYQIFSLCNDNFSYESIRQNSERKNFPWIDLCDTENHSHFREYYYIVSTPIMYLIDNKRRIASKLIGEDRITQALQALSL
ncbi:MAG: redoxin domain-containing protein [Bacteroidales bacterium]|nr:redoxin domain-containing protein [Bacteroidales bacterium]